MMKILNATLANAILSTITSEEIDMALAPLPESGQLNILTITEEDARDLLNLDNALDNETIWH